MKMKTRHEDCPSCTAWNSIKVEYGLTEKGFSLFVSKCDSCSKQYTYNDDFKLIPYKNEQTK